MPEPIIYIQSYNPYEARYPGRRVVSRETLHLIKTLREQEIAVIVEPDDGTKLNYTTEKGLTEFLADPVHALVVGIPVGIVVNMISSWLYDRIKRKPADEEVNIIIDVDEEGKRIHYGHSGKPIAEKRFQALLRVLERRAERYGETTFISPPDPYRPTPIYLEHTHKLIGWGRVSRDDKGLKIDDAVIINKRVLKRIKKGELEGASVSGLIYKATCMICKNDYVDCNHIASRVYDGKVCSVRIDGIDLAEISIVSKPVQPLAKIGILKERKRTPDIKELIYKSPSKKT